MSKIITNQEKESFFKVSLKQFEEWKEKPEELKNPIDRLVIFINFFNQFENRLRVFYWTTIFSEQFLYPTLQGELISLNKEDYKSIIRYPYPPNAPQHITLGAMNNFLHHKEIIKTDQFEDARDIIDLREELNQKYFFEQNLLHDENINDVIKSFIFYNKMLKRKKFIKNKMSPKFENIILQTTSSLVEECLLSNNEDIKLLNERFDNLPIEVSDSVFQQLKFFDYLYEIMGISEMTPLYEITKKLNYKSNAYLYIFTLFHNNGKFHYSNYVLRINSFE